MHKLIILLLATSSLASAEKLSFQQDLNLATDRLSAIDIISGAGDIVISTSDQPEILVNATIVSEKYQTMEQFKKVFDRDMVFKMERESQYAVLRGHSKPDLRKNPEIAIHLDIQIPASMDVKIDDGSGSITVSHLAGSLDIEDGSGNMVINHLSNSLNISDGSGDIEINHTNGSIEIDDGSGNIAITESHAKVEIEDGSGKITLSQVNGHKSIDDGSGEITIKNGQGDVEINDGSGDINLSNVAGNAKLKDGSGSIHIDNLGGELIIKSAGSGKVIIDGENRTKEF